MVDAARARSSVLLVVWGAAASVAGGLGLLRLLPPPMPQVLIAGMTVAFSIALARVGWLAEAASRIGVRGIVALHLGRFVGFAFLWLHAQGRLPAEFAQRAGWGDIAAAAGAMGLLFWPDGVGFRRALAVWNVFGALDLFLAVGTASWLNVTRPGSMVEITRLPLALVPLFAVPVLLASHVHILRTQLRGVLDVTGERSRHGSSTGTQWQGRP
jgi:hypothetical protein